MKHQVAGILFSGLSLVAGITSAAPMIFSDAGDDPTSIAGTVEAYRNALGALNPFDPVNGDPGGRRQINWDAAPDFISDPNPFPGAFFNGDAAPRARGIEFRETGTTSGFQLSATEASGEPPQFGFPDIFTPFSEERLFSPIDGNTFDVLFFDPSDQTTPAGTRGLGVVFNDVNLADTTTMTFYDQFGDVLASEAVATSNAGGLSFLGLVFSDPLIAKVSITAGSAIFSGLDAIGGDFVVMDDFIFGEPIAFLANEVPLPGTLPLMAAALAGLAFLRRKKQALQC